MAPNGAGSFFVFRLIQTLPTVWATRILILRVLFLIFLDPKFPDFQVPDSQIVKVSGELRSYFSTSIVKVSGSICTSSWAQARPKWVGPSWAQVGPSWAQARNLGPQKKQKIKILKIQIRSAQNDGKVWISRTKNPSGPIWAHLGTFFAWA